MAIKRRIMRLVAVFSLGGTIAMAGDDATRDRIRAAFGALLDGHRVGG
jgi:L-asparaginase/Glu-tRNA(Gln) amidotransferase subunit D